MKCFRKKASDFAQILAEDENIGIVFCFSFHANFIFSVKTKYSTTSF